MADLHHAVLNRDTAEVATLLGAGAPVDARDYRGATPLVSALQSDQFQIAELLLQHGADPFAMDNFYLSAAASAWLSRIDPAKPEGQARERVLARMRAAGVPIPPPDWQETKRQLADGRWPRRSAPPAPVR